MKSSIKLIEEREFFKKEKLFTMLLMELMLLTSKFLIQIEVLIQAKYLMIYLKTELD